MIVRKKILIVVLELSILLLGGCHSQKDITREGKTHKDDRNLRLISLLEKRSQRFNTLKIKRVDVNFSMNGLTEKVRGNIAIYRDSMIVVSVIPALGYEIVRIMCTKDSVIVINRTDKSYSATSFEHCRKKFRLPLGFNDLEAMLSNEVFYYKENYKERIYERKLTKREEKNLYLVDSFRDNQRITKQEIEIDREGRKIENVLIIDYEEKIKLKLEYKNFIEVEDILFPKNIKLNIVEKKSIIWMDIHYGQIVLDDSIHVKFSAPFHYMRKDI